MDELLTNVLRQVVEDHKMGLLPSDFFTKDHGRWLQLAARYGTLVEPIDAAAYARLGLEKRNNSYWDPKNRPSQHVYIEELEQAASASAAKG